MVRAYDVPADQLIQAVAEYLRRVPEVEPATWAPFAKTGSHADRPPQQANWWYVRAASILRKLYFHSPMGINDFEKVYGGSKQLGYNPKHHRDAGGSIVRTLLHQLEQAELVTKQGTKGRVLTPKGVAQLDKVSREVFKDLTAKRTELTRYG